MKRTRRPREPFLVGLVLGVSGAVAGLENACGRESRRAWWENGTPNAPVANRSSYGSGVGAGSSVYPGGSRLSGSGVGVAHAPGRGSRVKPGGSVCVKPGGSDVGVLVVAGAAVGATGFWLYYRQSQRQADPASAHAITSKATNVSQSRPHARSFRARGVMTRRPYHESDPAAVL